MAVLPRFRKSSGRPVYGRSPRKTLTHRLLRSFLHLIAWIFLVLVLIANVSNKPVLRETYFMKIDLSNIIPLNVPNARFINSIARSIGLHDFYQVGLWNFCEGYNDEGITFCSKPETLYWFNPIEIILSELLSGASSTFFSFFFAHHPIVSLTRSSCSSLRYNGRPRPGQKSLSLDVWSLPHVGRPHFHSHLSVSACRFVTPTPNPLSRRSSQPGPPCTPSPHLHLLARFSFCDYHLPNRSFHHCRRRNRNGYVRHLQECLCWRCV